MKTQRHHHLAVHSTVFSFNPQKLGLGFGLRLWDVFMVIETSLKGSIYGLYGRTLLFEVSMPDTRK